MLHSVSQFLAYDVSAFARAGRGGNMAGVVVVPDGDSFPSNAVMQRVAATAGYSEVVFARRVSSSRVEARYFTPLQEVSMCGHATLALFSLYIALGLVTEGEYGLCTQQADYAVRITQEEEGLKAGILFPSVRVEAELTRAEAALWYEALSIDALFESSQWLPLVKVNAGLSDILCPVADRSRLEAIRIDQAKLVALSQRYEVVGVHAYAKGDTGNQFYCRNFAPSVGIDEEAATGTSNIGLAYWLRQQGVLSATDGTMAFHQGDSMGQPSTIEVSFAEQAGSGLLIPILSGAAVVHDASPAWLSSLEPIGHA